VTRSNRIGGDDLSRRYAVGATEIHGCLGARGGRLAAASTEFGNFDANSAGALRLRIGADARLIVRNG